MKERLLRVIDKTRSWKLILHNNPDPDAIASAYAFSHLLTKFGKKSKIFYKGLIGRAENNEMVKRLKISLHPFEKANITRESNIAMFDCQPGAGNQPLSKKYIPKIVIDHHKLRRESSKAEFADIREGIGSSSTIVGEYYKSFNFEPDNKVATALYYGMKTDTFNFTRDFTKVDVNILNFIISFVSLRLMGKIENPSLSKEYFKKLSFAYNNAKIYKRAMIIDMEKVTYPDICAEIADLSIRMKDISWVLVFSCYNNGLYFSIRTRSRQKIAGKLAVSITKGLGSGGGHESSAGGMIQVKDIDEYFLKKELVIKRFLKKLRIPISEGVDFIPND